MILRKALVFVSLLMVGCSPSSDDDGTAGDQAAIQAANPESDIFKNAMKGFYQSTDHPTSVVQLEITDLVTGCTDSIWQELKNELNLSDGKYCQALGAVTIVDKATKQA